MTAGEGPVGAVDWPFGERPLPQTEAYAAAARSLTESVLSMEVPSGRLDALIAEMRAVDEEIRATAPVTRAVRVAGHTDDPTRRVYLDHSADIGSFNPGVPEYAFTEMAPDRATGSVTFPICFEGPPGCVHGGFLAVFFDAVLGHHSCAMGVSGATRSLEIRYRRPTPLATALGFTVDREVGERWVVCTVTLRHGDEVLCTARGEIVAGLREHLPRFGRRRAR